MKNPFQILQPSQDQVFKIGRKSDCDLIFDERYVSREHALIYFKKDSWFIKNQSQSSHTLCNNHPIEEKILEHGDSISIGTKKISISIKNQILQLLVLQTQDSSPLILSEDTNSLGRSVENSDAKIHSSSCPAVLAKVKKKETKAKFTFLNKIKIQSKKQSKNFELADGEKARLPWCSLEFCDSFLFLHHQLPGFSVEAKDLEVSINKKTLLHHINFYLPPGEILAVIGRSGQGKSTLLRLLLAEFKLGKNSSLLLNGISHQNQEIRKYIAFLEQEPELRKELTVIETLKHAAAITLPKDTSKTEENEIISNFLDLLGLKHLEHHKTASLSGGEARRVALARELIGSPGLILLDEPLAGLDPVNIKILCHHLHKLSLLGYTIILTTHGYEALEIADKVLVIHEGAEAFFGTPKETFLYFDTTSPASTLQSLKQSSLEKWENSPLKNRIFPEESNHPTFIFPIVKHASSFLLYTKILLRQYFRDKGKVFALLIQPLIIGFLFSQTFSKNSSLWIAAFALILSANWFALSLSIREIVQEKKLYAHELRKGTKAFSILFSKLNFIHVLAFFQAFICFLFLSFVLPLNAPFIPLFLSLITTILPATALGLMVSCFAKNTTQANILLPLLIIPQVILAGALVPLDQMKPIGNFLSACIPAKYNLAFLKNLFLGTPTNLSDLIIPTILAFIFYIVSWRLLLILGKAK